MGRWGPRRRGSASGDRPQPPRARASVVPRHPRGSLWVAAGRPSLPEPVPAVHTQAPAGSGLGFPASSRASSWCGENVTRGTGKVEGEIPPPGPPVTIFMLTLWALPGRGEGAPSGWDSGRCGPLPAPLPSLSVWPPNTSPWTPPPRRPGARAQLRVLQHSEAGVSSLTYRRDTEAGRQGAKSGCRPCAVAPACPLLPWLGPPTTLLLGAAHPPAVRPESVLPTEGRRLASTSQVWRPSCPGTRVPCPLAGPRPWP